MGNVVRFDHWVGGALDAYFADAGRGAGRGGADFITSPEVGPLFGEILARFVGEVRARLGRPSGFTVIEAGAGRGALLGPMRAALGDGIRFVAVERSPALRARLPDGVEAVAALNEVRGLPAPGVVIANELLDNLPFRLVGPDGEVWVDGAAEELRPPEGAVPAGAQVGRVPVQTAAHDWVDAARACLSAGTVLAVDYCSTTAVLARRPWTEWVRTFRAHGPGGHPLATPGAQDVTCVVCADQLPAADRDRSQADFLTAHGLHDLVAEGRRVWAERAHLGDLAALTARSRVAEAAALTDPEGLGALRALEWDVSPPT